MFFSSRRKGRQREVLHSRPELRVHFDVNDSNRFHTEGRTAVAEGEEEKEEGIMSYMQRVKVFGLLAGVGSAAGAYYVAQKDLWEYTRELAEALPGVPSLDLVKDTVAPSSEEQHEQHEQSAEAPLLAATESSGPMVDTNAWIQSWNSSVDLIFGKAINALCEKGL